MTKEKRKRGKRKRIVKKPKPIGFLTSPTRTYSAEAFITDQEVLEQDFVFMYDDGRKVIGRIDALQSQWDKGEEEVETYADISLYGTLTERGKITLKRKPMPPDTKVYKMLPDDVVALLALNEGIYVGKISLTETEVRINADKFLRGHTMAVGKTGSGKSWLIGVLLEEISKLDLPAIVIDPHGEYLSLANPWKEKKHNKALKKWGLESKGFKVKIITANPETKVLGQEFIVCYWPEELRDKQDPNLYFRRYGVISAGRGYARDTEEQTIEPDELDKWVEMYRTLHNTEPTVGDRYSDIRKDVSYEYENPNLLDPNRIASRTEKVTYTIRKGDVDIELSEIMEPGYITVIDLHNLDPDESRAVVDWLESKLFLMRKRREIEPFVNVLEEAHIFCPSIGKEWSTDTVLMLSKEARKFGMPTVFVCQRPVLLHTTVRANCENWIVLKITHPSDKVSIIDACEGLDAHSSETIKNLPVGHAFLTGTIVEFPLVTEVRYRQSQHHYESGFREQLARWKAIEGNESDEGEEPSSDEEEE